MKALWDRYGVFVVGGFLVILISAMVAWSPSTVKASTNELPGPVGRYQICPNGKFLNDFLMVDTCTGEVWRIACGAFGGEWKTIKITGARP